MCMFNAPKPPKAPVIPPPPPPADLNDQLNPLTVPRNPNATARRATLQSFRNDLTVGGNYTGLNIPR